jgi:hypothetical protein
MIEGKADCVTAAIDAYNKDASDISVVGAQEKRQGSFSG